MSEQLAQGCYPVE